MGPEILEGETNKQNTDLNQEGFQNINVISDWYWISGRVQRWKKKLTLLIYKMKIKGPIKIIDNGNLMNNEQKHPRIRLHWT